MEPLPWNQGEVTCAVDRQRTGGRDGEEYKEEPHSPLSSRSLPLRRKKIASHSSVWKLVSLLSAPLRAPAELHRAAEKSVGALNFPIFADGWEDDDRRKKEVEDEKKLEVETFFVFFPEEWKWMMGGDETPSLPHSLSLFPLPPPPQLPVWCSWTGMGTRRGWRCLLHYLTMDFW